MSPQPSLDRFKALQALYVEDDPVIRESGIELVEAIRAKDRKTPIVMVTAYSDKHYR